MMSSRKIFFYGSLCVLALAMGLAVSVCIPLPAELLRHDALQSMRITDCRGVLLRETLNDVDGRSQWVATADIAPSLIQATIAIEDKRFFFHPGVDPIAVTRALGSNLRSFSFAAGGSTLTQQVIKSIMPHERTLRAKCVEAWYALRLERTVSKEEIIEQYVNRVSYGGNIRGAESAAWRYFHKHARDLSLAESAFLAALPNAPALLDPYTHLSQARARQRLVLRRMREQNMIAPEDSARAALQPLQLHAPRSDNRAPHVCDMVVRDYRAMNAASVSTTIDEALQEQLQTVIDHHLARLAKRNVTNAAVVVIENRTGELRALLGSRDYFNNAIDGQVNGATALRQPGSAIKPLMYALAIESGRTASDIIADLPTAIPDVRGDYVPENYDRQFHGPVSIRTSLACSYNVPAVRVLESIGKESFLQRLRLCGFTSLTGTSDYYGYGLTLGNAEVSLLELTNAYRILANHGQWSPYAIVKEAKRADGVIVTIPETRGARSVYDEKAAFIISDILSDASARAPAFGTAFRFPFACAVKTGTTKDYKDNWTIGYTTRYTLGVWAGNFDGSPMRGVSGVTGAGQIFSEIMTLLHTAPYGTPPAGFEIPPGVERKTICPRSGLAPNRVCPNTVVEWFIVNTLPRTVCGVHKEYMVHDERGIESRKLFECYPPEYALWQQKVGMARPPADAEPVAEPGAGRLRTGAPRAPALSIASPNTGDRFKIDPVLRREYQTITIRGFIPDAASDVRLVIDRTATVPFASAGFQWKLEKGVHQFQLIAMLGDERITSHSVTITVE